MKNRRKEIGGLLLLLLLLLGVFGNGSNGSSTYIFRRLQHRRLAAGGGGENNKNNLTSVTPSPSPAPVPALSTSSPTPTTGDVGAGDVQVTEDRCQNSTRRSCQDDLHHNITACFVHPPTAPKELFLLVQNEGKGLVKVNVTISNTGSTFLEIPIPENQAKKINISAKAKGSSELSVTLNSANGKCNISMGTSKPRNILYNQLSDYATNMSPIHGAYLIFVSALIVGGIWMCCKMGKSDRHHVDGIQYQELEMGGQPEEPHSGTDNVETAEGWDEGWDDAWDEKKQETPSPNGHQRGNGSAVKTSETDGWENDWDD